MIKIGVTACFFYPDLSRTVFGAKSLTYLEKDMSLYLAQPGVMPILIPDLDDEELYPFLAEMDGFVLQGGDDLAPQTYGEEPIIAGKWLGDPHRDAYELNIVKYAIEHNKPVFGICRGAQLMNAYFGGTLYQDLTTQLPEVGEHRHAIKYDQVHHPVIFEKGKLLDELYQNDTGTYVNSIHHQGIKDLGKGLEVLAKSPEGIIEAFSWTGAEPGKVMAVQWHPEFFHNFKGDAKLIDAFIPYNHFLSFIR